MIRFARVSVDGGTVRTVDLLRGHGYGPLGLPIVTRKAVAPMSQPVTAVGTYRHVYTVRRATPTVRLAYGNWAEPGLVPSDVTFKVAVEHGGTLVPVTFSGVRTVTLPGGWLLSDPVAAPRAAGDILAVRTYLSAGTGFAPGATYPGNGEGFTAADLTEPGAQAVAAVYTWSLGPVAVLGGPYPGGRSVGIAGDSIGFGVGDDRGRVESWENSGYLREGGFLPRALDAAGLAYAQTAQSGETVNGAVVLGNFRRRHELLASCSHVICEYGRNDINGGAVGQTQTDLITFWRRCARAARYLAQTTITPRTTSSDAWTTAANQTAHGSEAARVALNTWIRDGAPLNSTTFAAVPAGSSPAGTIRAGQAGHPLKAYIEIADLAETARNSGLWRNGYTDDGLHPNGPGHAALAAALDLATLLPT